MGRQLRLLEPTGRLGSYAARKAIARLSWRGRTDIADMVLGRTVGTTPQCSMRSLMDSLLERPVAVATAVVAACTRTVNTVC